jgi:hypothetical protein
MTGGDAMTENDPARARGEAADEAADEAQRALSTSPNPTAEGSTVPADGPSGEPGDDPGRAARYEIHLSAPERQAVEQAPPPALRGHEDDADPDGPPP